MDDPILYEIHRAVGRIEAGMQSQKEQLDDYGKRLRALENWQYKTLGASGAVSLMVGILWHLLK